MERALCWSEPRNGHLYLIKFSQSSCKMRFHNSSLQNPIIYATIFLVFYSCFNFISIHINIINCCFLNTWPLTYLHFFISLQINFNLFEYFYFTLVRSMRDKISICFVESGKNVHRPHPPPPMYKGPFNLKVLLI